MTLTAFNDLVWQVGKFAAIAAFVIMDFTHSFPPHSWAGFFDQIFGWAWLLFVILHIIDAVTIKVGKPL